MVGSGPGRLLVSVATMPTLPRLPLPALSEFARDAALHSAYAAIPFGRLRGRQVTALVTASAALGAAATLLGLRAGARARAAGPDGWMPWTPQGQGAPAATTGGGRGPRSGEDRRALLRRSVIAAVAGTVAGAASAVEVVVDRRMEDFVIARGARHPRLVVGLSRGIAYAGLISLLTACRTRE